MVRGPTYNNNNNMLLLLLCYCCCWVRPRPPLRNTNVSKSRRDASGWLALSAIWAAAALAVANMYTRTCIVYAALTPRLATLPLTPLNPSQERSW